MTSEPFSSPPTDAAGPDALESYLAGRLDGAAAGRVERWLGDHPDARVVVTEFVTRACLGDVEPPDVRETLGRVHARRSGVPPCREFSGQPAHGRRMPWLPGRANGRGLATRLVSSGATAVAMVAVLLVVGLGVTRAWGRISHPGGTASPLVSTYATGNGQRADITLPDGSVVSLNVASRLEVPADFAAGNRTVRLVGSALFTVSRHDGRPFTVTAGSGVVRVLGTSFLVRHYETDSTVLVAVRDGKVSVRSLVLMATQQVELGPGTVSPVRPVNPGAFTFATGVLTLDGPPLSGAVEDLDRWYDADIRLGSPALAAQRITGKFAAGSLSDLAAILELTFDVRVVRDGRRLTLYSR